MQSDNLSANKDLTRTRIIDGLLAHAEDFGIGRFTMDDVARQAGLARITIYSHFRSKKELMVAAAQLEAERFFNELSSAAENANGSLSEVCAEIFVVGVTRLRDHKLLSRIIRAEPDVVLPLLVGDSPLPVMAIETGSSLIDDYQRRLKEITIDDPRPLSEFLVRLMLSMIVSPPTTWNLESETSLRETTQKWITPVVEAYSKALE